MTWIRALFAAGLSLVFPGAGHVLLRDWIRAMFFSGLFIMTVAFFVPEASAVASMDEAVTVINEKPWAVQFSLSFVFLLAAVDAGFRAVGLAPGGGRRTDGPVCPNCGKELDVDLEFCHWCTTRLEWSDRPVSDAPDEDPDAPVDVGAHEEGAIDDGQTGDDARQK